MKNKNKNQFLIDVYKVINSRKSASLVPSRDINGQWVKEIYSDSRLFCGRSDGIQNAPNAAGQFFWRAAPGALGASGWVDLGGPLMRCGATVLAIQSRSALATN